MKSARLLAGVLTALVAVGCAQRSGDDAASSGTGCDTSDDCIAGTCVGGWCTTTTNRITRVLLELKAPSSDATAEYSNLRFFVPATLGTGGDLPIELGVVSDVVVKMSLPGADCPKARVDSKGLVPVRVSLVQDPGFSGIYAQTYSGDSDDSDTPEGDHVDDNTVTLGVPPGEFDLYVASLDTSSANATEASECSLPPLLVRGQSIAMGNVLLKQPFPVPKLLDVDVRFPRRSVDGSVSPFEGWTLDMVEPVGGRLISTQALLVDDGTEDAEVFHHRARLAYNPVSGVDAEALAGSELVRISPPDGVVAPTFYVTRSALALFGSGEAVLDQVVELPNVVTVEGRVEGAGDAAPQASEINVVSTDIALPTPGALASFRVAGQSDADGGFSMKLVAGTHRVIAVPTEDAGYGVLSSEWAIAPTPAQQAGKLLQLPKSSLLEGSIRDESSGKDLTGATVSAVPSPAKQQSVFLNEILGNTVVAAMRNRTAAVDDDGRFSLRLDEGEFDLRIAPPEELQLPWAIRPRVAVGAKTTSTGELGVPLSVVYTGMVTVSGTGSSDEKVVLPGVEVWAYALLGSESEVVDSEERATGVVAIGYSRADKNGQFLLVLPDRLE